MQVRIWGTEKENAEMLEILKSSLSDKIKIISSPYLSEGNDTQRIYVEIDLENTNYRKTANQEGFSEDAFFENLNKRFSP